MKCFRCSKEFEPKVKWQRFCSGICYERSRDRKDYRIKNRKRDILKNYEWAEANPEKRKVYIIRNKMKRLNATFEDYINAFKEQEGCCAICGVTEVELNKQLSIDHCHKENKFRGLLCNKCNMGLGHFLDNPDLLRKAADYVEEGNLK